MSVLYQRKKITDAPSFLVLNHYRTMDEIALHFGLYGLSNRIALIDDDYYISCVFSYLNSIDYLQFIDEILLDIYRFINDPSPEEW